MTQRSRYGIVASLLVALMTMTGCSAGSAPGAGDFAAGEPPQAEGIEEASGVVITGTITITTEEPLLAAERATELVHASGGRVSARHETSANSYAAESAVLTLRVPAERLDIVRGQLAELGRIDSTWLESMEVGAAQRDLDARITTLHTSISRYTIWLEQSNDVEALIALEQAISQRQGELERLEAEQRELADQVALSTIELTLRSSATAGDPPPSSFWEGLVRGWEGFVTFWATMLVVLGYTAPWLALLGLTAFLVVWLVRRRRRARAAEHTHAHLIPSGAAPSTDR